MPVEPQAALAEKDGARLPALTAVIPAYNAAETIERALSSVYSQTYRDLAEVIVVDDGSADGTAEVVRDAFPDVILIEQENAGVSAARNAGAARATGEFIAFLDADDEWLPHKLQEQVAAVAARPGIALLLCQEITVPVNGPPQHGQETEGLTQFTARDWLSGRAVKSGVSLSCSGWLFRRECLLQLGGFDDSLRHCNDFEMALRTAAMGYGTAALPRGLFLRHMQEQSVSQGPQSLLRRARKACEVVRRYDPGVEGPGRGLLAQVEYGAILRYYLFHLFYHLALEGEVEEAREVAREVRSLGGGGMAQMVATVGSWWPALPATVVKMLRGRSRPRV